MKKIVTTILCSLLVITVACSDNSEIDNGGGKKPGIITSDNLAEQNILRAMQMVDSAMLYHFKGEGMAMSRFYNPYTKSNANRDGSDEKEVYGCTPALSRL